MNIVSKEDYDIITEQLGRRPQGLQYVCVRDAREIPAVIKVAPIVKGKPFPNLYWLCHKELSKKIDHLEAIGLIKKLEKEILPSDENFLNQLIDSHRSYAQERFSEFEKTERLENYPENFIKNLKEKGVGGLGDFKRVRCLHMHYAHHLVGFNPIGHYLDQNYPELKECLS